MLNIHSQVYLCWQFWLTQNRLNSVDVVLLCSCIILEYSPSSLPSLRQFTIDSGSRHDLKVAVIDLPSELITTARNAIDRQDILYTPREGDAYICAMSSIAHGSAGEQ